MEALNGIPGAAQPLFWPILGIMCTLIGFAFMVSMGNPSLRAAAKEHIGYLILGAVFIFFGATMVTNFLVTAGVPGPAAPAVVRTP